MFHPLDQSLTLDRINERIITHIYPNEYQNCLSSQLLLELWLYFIYSSRNSVCQTKTKSVYFSKTSSLLYYSIDQLITHRNISVALIGLLESIHLDTTNKDTLFYQENITQILTKINNES
jgi:hypothetical protein